MKPILFNTEMVRAILDDRKTATRRVVKGYPLEHLELDVDGSIIGVYDQFEGSVFPIMDYAPYCPGDILYVRETWCINNITPHDPEWNYKADFDCTDKPYCNWKWHPSIHMPKEAARMFLRVKAVRVERLRPMGLDDFEAEGLNTIAGLFETTAKFADLWDSTINPTGLDIFGWEANPWVWVIEFERITKEEAEHG